MDDLERGLITEISAGATDEGGSYPLMEICVRPGAMPSVTITDKRGVVDHCRISFVELLKALDDSATVSALRKEDVKTTELPELPAGTLRASLIERPRGNSYLITGWVEAGERTFVLESGGHKSAHQIPLPAVLYTTLYDGGAMVVTNLWISMLSPEREGGTPAEHEPLYRWAFSNTYSARGLRRPSLHKVVLELGEPGPGPGHDAGYGLYDLLLVIAGVPYIDVEAFGVLGNLYLQSLL